jgi:hypothetical protein
MLDGLEVPYSLTGGGIQTKDRVRKQVVTMAVRAIEVKRR